MKNPYIVTLLACAFSVTLNAQLELTNPDFLDNGGTLTTDEAGSIDSLNLNEWVRVSHFTSTGADSGTKVYEPGEMGRLPNNQNNPRWFGQVVNNASSFTGSYNLVIDTRYKSDNRSEDVLVEVYGTNSFSDFLLNNDTQDAGWTLLNTTTEFTVSDSRDFADNTEFANASSLTGTTIIDFDLASGYDFVGVRFRTTSLGNNSVPEIFAVTNANFSAIPEPSTVGLIFAAATAGLVVLRRRKN